MNILRASLCSWEVSGKPMSREYVDAMAHIRTCNGILITGKCKTRTGKLENFTFVAVRACMCLGFLSFVIIPEFMDSCESEY